VPAYNEVEGRTLREHACVSSDKCLSWRECQLKELELDYLIVKNKGHSEAV